VRFTKIHGPGMENDFMVVDGLVELAGPAEYVFEGTT
jgi:hypothetical protein